jgi:hypothetical protein
VISGWRTDNGQGIRHEGISVAAVLSMGLVAIAAFVLIAKNLSIDNSVVFNDEYLYRVWADPSLDRKRLLAWGVVPPMPNRLFAFVYGISFLGSLNAYDIAQFLNVIFWAIGTFTVLGMAMRYRVSGAGLVTMTIALVLLPWSSFTKYFMPEVMYAASLLAGFWLLLEASRRESLKGMALAGASVAALYFVKPHAVFVLFIDAAFLLTLPSRRRAVPSLLAGFTLGYFLFRKAIPKLPMNGGSSLGVYSTVAHDRLARITGSSAGVLDMLPDVFKVAEGHLLMFFFLCGLPLAAMIGAALPRARLLTVVPDWRLFSRYLLILTFGMMAVSIIFTVAVGEIGLVHSRYYAFVWPLWVVAIAMMRDTRLTRRGAAVATVFVGLGAAAVLAYAVAYSNVISLSFVTGSPEWGFVFADAPVRVLVVAAMGATALYVAWTGRGLKTHMLVFAIAALVSSVVTAQSQKGVYRNAFADGRDAVAVQQIVGKPELSRTLVIGANSSEVNKFLFFLEDVPHIAYLPHGSATANTVAAEPAADWAVLLSSSYAAAPTYTCEPVGTVRLCRKGTAPL